jgi:hypothetical protein
MSILVKSHFMNEKHRKYTQKMNENQPFHTHFMNESGQKRRPTDAASLERNNPQWRMFGLISPQGASSTSILHWGLCQNLRPNRAISPPRAPPHALLMLSSCQPSIQHRSQRQLIAS